MTLKSLNKRSLTVIGAGLLLSLLTLTCWSAEATGFDRHSAQTDNSIPTLKSAAAIRYLKEHKLSDSLRTTLNAARTPPQDYSVLTPLFVDEQKLTASEGAAFDNFGRSVAVSGSTIVVGAPFDSIGGNVNQGSVYVFNRQGGSWVETQKLTASDGTAGDFFGFSVAFSSSTIVVGSIADTIGGNVNQGSAYVFNRQGGSWVETQKLTASDGMAGDGFGFSVAFSGSAIVVGADNDDVDNFDQGSAYVFDRSGGSWVETQKLTAGDGVEGDQFGWSVAVSGSTIVVGSIDDAIGGNSFQGSAYVFNRQGTGWVETQKLTASDGAAEDSFGWSVAVSGSTIVVGVPFDSIGGISDPGSAYVFNRQGGSWVETQKLTASDGTAGDFLGFSVAFSGSTILVGAFGDDIGGNFEQGSAYAFERHGGSWVETQKLTVSDGAANDNFGHSVAVSGSIILVGAPFVDIGKGAAYVFEPQRRIAR